MARATLAFLLAFSGFLYPGVRAGKQESPSAFSGSVRRTGYVGDAACLACHKVQSIPYQHTAHSLTSQPPNRNSILGSFKPGSNVLMMIDPDIGIADPNLYFKMEEKSGGYYVTAVAEPGSLVQPRSERIDVVIGSGVRGQSYLYWHGEQLYELPVSYLSDGRQWVDSPGYRSGTADFSRPVYPRCLECHVTYIKALSADPRTNSYDKESLVTGIFCETCHGPGAEHIERQNARPASKEGSAEQAILNPAKFSRDRQVDLCALCHNGIQRDEVKPAFSYIPGKPLDDYLTPNPVDAVMHPDVHGNQVGLLKKSRCYLSSPAMTCSTCHDVHAPERAAAAYSDRCLSCHRWESCGMSKKMGRKIANNCIDCHMPLQPTSAIVLERAVVRPTLRSHWIKVYPEPGNSSE